MQAIKKEEFIKMKKTLNPILNSLSVTQKIMNELIRNIII